jgi:hypothetical protein
MASCTATQGHVVCDGHVTYCSPLKVVLTPDRLGRCDAGSDLIEYMVNASASGGTGSYLFSWSGVDEVTTPTHAITRFSEPSHTISVTVASDEQQVTKSATLLHKICD